MTHTDPEHTAVSIEISMERAARITENAKLLGYEAADTVDLLERVFALGERVVSVATHGDLDVQRSITLAAGDQRRQFDFFI